MGKYILSVDQSTQGTKGLLFDEHGHLAARADKSHRQIISKEGWVSHDLKEILNNTLEVCRQVIEKAGISKDDVAAMGISNQRETTAAWNRVTGEPVCDAIVWQCSRAKEICEEIASKNNIKAETDNAGSSIPEQMSDPAELVRKRTGIPLSAYFPAAKMAWILRNVPEAALMAGSGLTGEKDSAEGGNRLALGTIDSWLVYSLCQGHPHKCDYSNAGRTQLFNIQSLEWDEDLCRIFGIPKESLPEVCMSDSCFGYTDLGGYLDHPVPVNGVLGDSHGALLGHGGTLVGSIKATYGTGSSVMMNVGDKPVFSESGLVSSIAWGLNGKVSYVLEGNLNYTGAVITWLKDDVQLIRDAAETEKLAREANPLDRTYFVPAFSGLGAPYWDSDAAGMLTGMTRSTGRKEIVKACLESIAYQITDLIKLMEKESRLPVAALRTDGGPTGNTYLMQFQADISGRKVYVPSIQEFSGLGAALAAGMGSGAWSFDEDNQSADYRICEPAADPDWKEQHYNGWQEAVQRVLFHNNKA